MCIPFSGISVDRKLENAQDQTLAGLRRNPSICTLRVRRTKRQFADDKLTLYSTGSFMQPAAKKITASSKRRKPRNNRPETQPFYLLVAGG